MKIDLQWAFSMEDMMEGPCVLCEADFEPRAVIIRCDPYGLQACEGCLQALSGRKEALPGAPWPTWEEYEALVAAHLEPMFASAEEVATSEEETADPETGSWPAYDASWLWKVSEEDDILHITPTVLYRMDRDTMAVAVVERQGEGLALLVFRWEGETEKYRAGTGKHPEAEGWRPVGLDLRDLANLLKMHGCTHVGMPEEWTGTGGVDFFAAPDFIAMLEASAPA